MTRDQVYNASRKGKARNRRYEQGESAKARQKAYRKRLRKRLKG